MAGIKKAPPVSLTESGVGYSFSSLTLVRLEFLEGRKTDCEGGDARPQPAHSIVGRRFQ
jgi:hypothetical protein